MAESLARKVLAAFKRPFDLGAVRHDVRFPRAWMGDTYDWSFSGLKTAARKVVTDADLASETLVRALIHERRPNDSITGEEFDGLESASAKVR